MTIKPSRSRRLCGARTIRRSLSGADDLQDVGPRELLVRVLAVLIKPHNLQAQGNEPVSLSVQRPLCAVWARHQKGAVAWVRSQVAHTDARAGRQLRTRRRCRRRRQQFREVAGERCRARAAKQRHGAVGRMRWLARGSEGTPSFSMPASQKQDSSSSPMRAHF
jgi:hypothetical protein